MKGERHRLSVLLIFVDIIYVVKSIWYLVTCCKWEGIVVFALEVEKNACTFHKSKITVLTMSTGPQAQDQ
jgi:hypothetical protein